MNKEQLMQVLLRPHISEKSTMVADHNHQVVFSVETFATKAQIKAAVELLFEVEVENVQVMNVRGKIKRFGRTPGRRQGWKKAYVKLKEGNDIDFLGSGA